MLTGTVTDVVCRFAPGAGVKVNTACVIDRAVAKPFTVTVSPVEAELAVIDEITGATDLITTELDGAGVGVTFCDPASSCAVMVAVPATVPNCTPMELSEAEVPAGMVS